ncbi:MAG: CPBP family intramembrane metalloprotease [Clostridiales bacterium]|nr:CPBP family intramembrane metalloprotease [Clostridiales bacterium]
MKDRFRVSRLRLQWALPAVLIPGLCILISSWVMGYLQAAYIPWDGGGVFYLLNVSAMLIGSVAEEIGWRGFLLPRLQKRHSPFISSLIVGILWGVWHFNFTGGIAGFIFYTITIIEMSILMTWVYNKSKGSLLLMSLWHLTINITSRVFLWERFNLQLFKVQSIVFGLACVILLAVDGKSLFSKVPADALPTN